MQLQKGFNIQPFRQMAETKFFTGLEKRALFDLLHDYIAPFVQRSKKGS